MPRIMAIIPITAKIINIINTINGIPTLYMLLPLLRKGATELLIRLTKTINVVARTNGGFHSISRSINIRQ